LPAQESFRLHQQIYRIEPEQFERTRDELVDLLDVRRLLGQPVRELSLGERMKMELIAALLHSPEVLFLDEPTIGLDITAQARIRSFLQEYNRRTGATILLTSHYMADVTALCERIIMIHQGQLKYDGSISDLSRRIAPFKLIGVALADAGACDLSSYGTLLENSNGDGKRLIQVPAKDVAAITARLLSDLTVQDLTIEDPPIEDVIERAFHE
jgi:ABC-2 type transport system ATP-binding protein